MLSKINTSIAGIGLAITLASCGGNNQQAQMGFGADGPVWIKDTVVTETDAKFDQEYPGTTVSFNQVNLIPQVTGYISAVYFQDGQNIVKGQRLYKIDAQVYDANVANAQANVAVQEANLVKAQKDADRYHALAANDAVAKQLVDNADAALAAAQKQVAAAEAQVRSLNSNVKFTTIYAPFSGTIGISQVKPGMAVFAGQTVLNTVSTNSPMAVDFNIDQSELLKYEGLRKSGTSNIGIDLGTTPYAGKGKIAMIDRAVNGQTGTIKVRLSFANGSNDLKPGMNVTVKVPNSDAKSLVIPYKAVVEQLGEFFVYVIKSDSTVTQTHVQLGTALGSTVVVKNGLEAGQSIVTEGTQKLKEGAKITLAPPAAASAQTAAKK